MGNIHSSSDHDEEEESPPPPPRPSRTSLCTFLLGGPMPATPGIIPLCWDELLDWADDATFLAEVVHQRNAAISQQLRGSTAASSTEQGRAIHIKRGIRFVPYVSLHETEDALRKLASQSYMERAQFYQESVLVAVEDVEKTEILCLTSLFQFCRYYTLIRRLADSYEMVLEYPPTGATLTAAPPIHNGPEEQSPIGALLGGDATSLETEDKEPSTTPLLAGDEQPSDGPLELDECAICFDKTEDSVLMCCSHALCADCEKRWVRKHLCCPFCRQSFSSVKEAVQTQWQLGVKAVPVDQVLDDVRSLESTIAHFWRRHIHEKDSSSLPSILEENYVARPKAIQSCAAVVVGEELDEFVVIEELSLSCALSAGYA
ncbi:expressed unknown protein [Seminavis robusta]|uniref:RING-type domain-containing protein n=1 Tax=Seminavis robusta TaxID=568900 RepID=A0A9N8H7C6_9STRA|nr:expressed unknown protein [Seminavis robusta]|eukprot:Sro65_g036840.1 n/a (374) ;mRNA; f:97312-98535